MNRAFTLIELLVVVAILALLIAILLPSLSRAREQGRSAACLSNMRSLGLAVQMYAMNNRGFLVNFGLSHGGSVDENETWLNTLRREYRDKLVARCPSDASPYWTQPHPVTRQVRRTSYGVNDYLSGRVDGYEDFRRLDRIRRPATTVMFVELNETTDYASSDHVHPPNWVTLEREAAKNELALDRHVGKANYTFADGHAEALRFERTYRKKGMQKVGKQFVITWEHNLYDPKVAW
ncbi:MAG: prepilin-type N-terminal cleavage/methylation domain-containing protein [Phycisphaerae bacterium]